MAKATAKNTPIAAISCPIVDPATGATLAVHVVKFYQVDIANAVTTGTLAGYVSDAARMEGRNPVNHTTVAAPGVAPVGEDPVQWLYSQIIAADVPTNVLAGATPVYAEA